MTSFKWGGMRLMGAIAEEGDLFGVVEGNAGSLGWPLAVWSVRFYPDFSGNAYHFMIVICRAEELGLIIFPNRSRKQIVGIGHKKIEENRLAFYPISQFGAHDAAFNGYEFAIVLEHFVRISEDKGAVCGTPDAEFQGIVCL